MRHVRSTTSASTLALAIPLALALAAPAARAHHVPGHGASEGVRNINSLGGRGGRAQTRLLVLDEIVYARGGLNPSVANTTSIFGEYAPIPALSLAVQAPFLVVHDLGGSGARVGYGDTRVQLRVTPHAQRLIHRVVTLGLSASLPTRTLRLAVDPGPVTSIAPNILFTRTYDRQFWQLMGLAVVDRRRAGTALDLTLGGQAGTRLGDGKTTLGVGALFDLRLANFCADPSGGAAFCTTTRPGEDDRPVGAARALVLVTAARAIGRRGHILTSVQAPLTTRADFTVAGSVGAQISF